MKDSSAFQILPFLSGQFRQMKLPRNICARNGCKHGRAISSEEEMVFTGAEQKIQIFSGTLSCVTLQVTAPVVLQTEYHSFPHLALLPQRQLLQGAEIIVEGSS